MRVRFWGTRGLLATPGHAYQRYGGATVCAEITSSEGTRVIVDLGTGCIPLGHALMAESAKGGSKRFGVLLSNTQIDHIQGLPFFVPALVPGWDLTIRGPANAGRDIEGVLDSALNPNYSPLYSIGNLAAKLVLETLDEGEHKWDGIRIITREMPHATTRALGFRIEADGKSMAYLTDVEYAGDPSPAAIELAMGVDVLVHDAMATAEGVVKRAEFEHASPDDAVFVARESRAKRLVLYHHDPDRTDVHMDVLLEKIKRGAPDLTIEGAREGQIIDL